MKYKVGDKVRVRSDLEGSKTYCMEHNKHIHDSVVEEMQMWAGDVVTIKEYTTAEEYRIEECGWNWTDEMFEGLVGVTFHEYDTVKHGIYGIGTVISKRKSRNGTVLVDFDKWDSDFPSTNNNECYVTPDELTLVKAYVKGED